MSTPGHRKPLLCRVGLHAYLMDDHDEIRWGPPIPGTDPPKAKRYHVRPMYCERCGGKKDYVRRDWPAVVTTMQPPSP